MGNDYQANCSILLCSSDKYATAWHPYFELLKRYWKDRPSKIYLNSENKSYTCDSLDVQTFLCQDKISWSERLYRCLEKIPTKYIIFSLEDFFLLDDVKNERIQKAYEYMEADASIAVCRLCPSDDERLQKCEEYGDFRIANNDIPYRLDTQVSLWNRQTLMSFLDFSEDPWQFESLGTERTKDTDKKFLYYYQEDALDLSQMIYPYFIRQDLGHGIAWGRWLWNTRIHLEKNGICDVDYKKLGTLSQKAVTRRFKYLYNKEATGVYKVIQVVYRLIDRMQRSAQFFRIFGPIEGFRRLRDFINR